MPQNSDLRDFHQSVVLGARHGCRPSRQSQHLVRDVFQQLLAVRGFFRRQLAPGHLLVVESKPFPRFIDREDAGIRLSRVANLHRGHERDFDFLAAGKNCLHCEVIGLSDRIELVFMTPRATKR